MPTVVFAVALVFRLACFIQSFDNPLLFLQVLDESYYIGLGKAIASGFIIGERELFYMDPLYGYLLGAFFWLFGPDLLYTRIFQIILDSLNSALVAIIGARFGGKVAGLAGGLLYAVYGPVTFFSLLILKVTLSLTLTLVFVIVLMRAIGGGKWTWWVTLGVTGGLAVFTRANHAIMVVLAPVVYMAISRPGMARLSKNMACYLAGLMIILCVGAARNYVAVGELAILTSAGGRTLYMSQNPDNLNCTTYKPPFSRGGPENLNRDFQREAEKRLGKKLTPSEVSNYWRDETLRFIVDNPGTMVMVLARKLYGSMGDYEVSDNHSYKLWSRFAWGLGLPFPTFAFLLAAGAPGLYLLTRRDKRALCLWLPVFGTLLTMMIFCPSARYRIEAIPFLAAGAGFCVIMVHEWIACGEKARLAFFATAFFSLFAISKSFPAGVNCGDDEFSLSKAYLNIKDIKGAWETASKGMELFPEQDRFPRILGLAAISEGDAQTAIKMTGYALSIRPDSPEGWHHLGLAHLMKGDAARAVECLSKAIELDSGPMSYIALGQAYEAMGDKAKAIAQYERFIAVAKPGDSLSATTRERVIILRGTGG